MNAHNNSNRLSQHQGNLNSLDDQLKLHLNEVANQAKAQELAKIIGKDEFDLITQVWPKLNFAQSDFTNEILENIKNMGIKVDDELKNLVETEPQSVVRDAFEAYKEALEQKRVSYHASFLKAAIRKRYAPNYYKGIAA